MEKLEASPHGASDAHERSRHYGLDSDSDPEDAELAREVDAAIAEAFHPESKGHIRPIVKDEDVPESELLQVCAQDLERLKQAGSGVQIAVPATLYQPQELKFSDEIYLQELKNGRENAEKLAKIEPEVVTQAEKEAQPKADENLTASAELPSLMERTAAGAVTSPQIAPVPPKTAQPVRTMRRSKEQQQQRVEQNRKKEEEMKRMLEEMNMMDEDERGHRLAREETKLRFAPYVQPLPASAVLEFVGSGRFVRPIGLPSTQRLAVCDPDEAFLKYGIQQPLRISPKQIQDLFAPIIVVNTAKPETKKRPDGEDIKTPESSTAKSEEKKKVPSISAYFTKKLEDRKMAPIPQIELSLPATKAITILRSALKIPAFSDGPEDSCCWAKKLVSSPDWMVANKISPTTPPPLPTFLRDTFYAINRLTGNSKLANGKEEKKAPSMESEEEQKQMAQLNEMCALDELRLLDTLPETAEEIEVKLESKLDLTQLAKFHRVKRLVLPMNCVTSLESLRPLRTLREVYISQNKIARMDPAAFRELEELRVLHLDVNLIGRIEGLENCRKLEVLKLDNNHLTFIGGLKNCVQLTNLHLYRNQIGQISGLETLGNLQHLDVGRNKLTSADYLNDPAVCPMLSELLLYYNEIADFPSAFSKPLLKSLWINGNKLQHFGMGWCPMLDLVAASDNAISVLDSFRLAKSLHSLDVSFNNLKDLAPFFESFRHNTSLRSLKFNDNPFEKGREGTLNCYITRMLPSISQINSESVKESSEPRAEIHDRREECKGCLQLAQVLQYSSLAAAEQMLVSRIVNGEKYRARDEKVSFFPEDPVTAYFIRYLSAFHMRNLLSLQRDGENSEYFTVTDTVQLHRDAYLACKREKEAARKIVRFFRRKRTEGRVRLRRYRKHEAKLLRIQAWVRGTQTRKLYRELFAGKLGQKFRKGNRQEQMAIRIQAAVRGFLLRKRIKKGLEKVRAGNAGLDDCPEIDVDNFLGMKAPPETEDMIMIPDQAQLNVLLKSIREPKPVPAAPSSLPAISGNKTGAGTKKPAGKQPRREEEEDKGVILPELPLNSKNLNMLPPAMGAKMAKRPSEISEYELRSDNKSERSTQYHGAGAMDAVKQHMDNYIAEERKKMMHEKTEAKEKTKKFVEDWGFKDPNTKKVIEMRMNKMIKRQKKTQKLTAEQKYQRFLANKPPTSSKVLPGN